MSIVRVLGIVGLIALLILGAWGIILIAVHIPAVLATIGSVITAPFSGHRTTPPVATTTPSSIVETLSVTSPQAAVASGSVFNVSWNHVHTGTDAYSYALAYSCASGLSLQAPLPTGSYQSVTCGTRFNYTNAQNGMPLKATYSGTGTATTQLTVYAVKLSTGSTTAAGMAPITVQGTGSSAATPPKTTTPYTTGYPSKGYSTGYTVGYPDLAVTIVYSGPGEAQFRIQNVGGATVPAGWIFTANIPGQSPYTSAPQRTLTPGSGIVNTLTWTLPYGYGNPNGYGNQTYGYSGPFSVTVDPYHWTGDVNYSNNYATAPY